MGIILYIIYTYKPHYTIVQWLSNTLEVSYTILTIILLLNIPLHGAYTIIAIQLLFVISIFIFTIQEQGIISKILHHKAFQYLGLLSYSIYLIHAIVVEIAGHIFEYILKTPVTLSRST